MIRRWSEYVYAVYVEDGLFGRRVDLVDARENVALPQPEPAADTERLAKRVEGRREQR